MTTSAKRLQNTLNLDSGLGDMVNIIREEVGSSTLPGVRAYGVLWAVCDQPPSSRRSWCRYCSCRARFKDCYFQARNRLSRVMCLASLENLLTRVCFPVSTTSSVLCHAVNLGVSRTSTRNSEQLIGKARNLTRRRGSMKRGIRRDSTSEEKLFRSCVRGKQAFQLRRLLRLYYSSSTTEG